MHHLAFLQLNKKEYYLRSFLQKIRIVVLQAKSVPKKKKNTDVLQWCSGGVTSMNPFLMKFFPSVYRKEQEAERNQSNQYCKFDSQLLTMFTSSLYLAALVASFFAATVTRVAGRK